MIRNLTLSIFLLIGSCAQTQNTIQFPSIYSSAEELHEFDEMMIRKGDFRIEKAITGKELLALNAAVSFYERELNDRADIAAIELEYRHLGFFATEDEFVIRFGAISVPYHDVYPDDPTPFEEIPESRRFTGYPLTTLYFWVSKENYKVKQWQIIPSEKPNVVN